MTFIYRQTDEIIFSPDGSTELLHAGSVKERGLLRLLLLVVWPRLLHAIQILFVKSFNLESTLFMSKT